jgi:hypothetical protein
VEGTSAADQHLDDATEHVPCHGGCAGHTGRRLLAAPLAVVGTLLLLMLLLYE